MTLSKFFLFKNASRSINTIHYHSLNYPLPLNLMILVSMSKIYSKLCLRKFSRQYIDLGTFYSMSVDSQRLEDLSELVIFSSYTESAIQRVLSILFLDSFFYACTDIHMIIYTFIGCIFHGFKKAIKYQYRVVGGKDTQFPYILIFNE